MHTTEGIHECWLQTRLLHLKRYPLDTGLLFYYHSVQERLFLVVLARCAVEEVALVPTRGGAREYLRDERLKRSEA